MGCSDGLGLAAPQCIHENTQASSGAHLQSQAVLGPQRAPRRLLLPPLCLRQAAVQRLLESHRRCRHLSLAAALHETHGAVAWRLLQLWLQLCHQNHHCCWLLLHSQACSR
jgi:hypothetical protein